MSDANTTNPTGRQLPVNLTHKKGATDAGQLPLGTLYLLQEEIGRGPAAKVYRALANETGQEVAVKVFHRRYSNDPRFAVRFRNHLKTLITVSHEHLVRILDYGMIDGRFYIATEWVAGQDLGSYLAEHGPLPALVAIQISRQVCSALETIHAHGLVHQGLKPQNILLSAGSQVKVCDVGLSSLLSETGLSRTNVMLGGVNYMSPEQARGKATGPQSDLYSLGVLLFEMLANQPPFQSNDAWSVIRMHTKQEPPRLRQLNPQIPDALAEVVYTAMQKSQQGRYANAGEYDLALAQVQADLVASMNKSLATESPKRDPSLWQRLVAAIRSVKQLLVQPSRLMGQAVPFGVVLLFQLAASFVIAYAIIYLLTALVPKNRVDQLPKTGDNIVLAKSTRMIDLPKSRTRDSDLKLAPETLLAPSSLQGDESAPSSGRQAKQYLAREPRKEANSRARLASCYTTAVARLIINQSGWRIPIFEIDTRQELECKWLRITKYASLSTNS